MKGLCIYVDGGKGHYVPAKAVSDALTELEVETQLVEFFEYLDIRWIGKINKFYWRTMLRMPSIEKKLSRHNDSDSNGMEMAIKYAIGHCARRLKAELEKFTPDFVFATHPYPGTIIAEMFSALKINIPVYYFATDVFSAPVAAICNKLRRFYIATEEGAGIVKSMGQKPETIEICPFPLQKVIAESPKLEKKEARKKLSLDEDVFTLQLNLGGEGIGSVSLLSEIVRKDLPLQVVIIGGADKSTHRRIDSIIKTNKGKAKIEFRGFVKNVNEYLAASDIIVGRAGINTIVEAIYAHRPFLITELVYTVIPSAEYLEKYNIGWNAENNLEKQIGIIERYSSDEYLLEEMDRNFEKVPLEYSAKKLAGMIVRDAESYKVSIHFH